MPQRIEQLKVPVKLPLDGGKMLKEGGKFTITEFFSP